MPGLNYGNIYIEDHTDELKIILKSGLYRGLVKIGMQAERFAKEEISRVVYATPEKGYKRTGRLRNSITNYVDAGEKAVYIGTNVEYAVYVECGTGRQSTAGGNPLKKGMAPRPFLKPAATQHTDVYQKLIKSEFK